MAQRAPTSSILWLVSEHRPDFRPYEDLYRHLHENPELSLQEKSTAATMASRLKEIGPFDIRSKIGGHGLVGILRNGPGKTVLLRVELDALPIEERTGSAFSSTKRAVDVADNVEKPVMHACGHDLHMVSVLAAAELLYKCRAEWRGTIIVLFQPNEERGAGAQAMVDDGLYDKHAVPKPDVALGSHVMPMRAGFLSTRKGVLGAAADSFLVKLYGRGGHGSRPHQTVDPVVLASSTVMKLQTIVSRSTDPREMAVVTVGSIQAGSTENVISEEATLKINTRSFSKAVQKQVVETMERIIHAECQAFGSPKPPSIQQTSSFPLLYNDETATDVASAAMKKYFGKNFSTDALPSTGSEDFANLTNPLSIPSFFWNYGGIDPDLWDDAEKKGLLGSIPGNHSAGFLPILQPTLTIATDAWAVAALAFLLQA